MARYFIEEVSMSTASTGAAAPRIFPDDFRESGRAQGLGTQEHSIAVLFGDLDQFTMRGVRGGRHFVIESLANRPAYSKTHS